MPAWGWNRASYCGCYGSKTGLKSDLEREKSEQADEGSRRSAGDWSLTLGRDTPPPPRITKAAVTAEVTDFVADINRFAGPLLKDSSADPDEGAKPECLW